MKKTILSIVSVFLWASVAQAGSVAWSVDKAHSEVSFKVRHLGLSNVRGHFNEFDATTMADAKTGKITSVEATAKTASVDTGMEKRDGHLQSDDFFNAAKYPTLKAKLTSIKWKGDNFTAQATLTLRDITKKVTFKGELIGTHKVNFGSGDQLRAGYQAETKINRKEFGLKFNSLAEGVSVVSDEVTIILDIQIYRSL